MRATSINPSFSIKKAHETQQRMAKRIIKKDALPRGIQLVAGVDVTYWQDCSVGAVAVLDFESLELVESQTSICRTRFPYIPTLLSFREVPPAVLAIKKLAKLPDVFLVDGQGYAHPYRCGFASHLGLVLNKPTIGVAKTRLLGKPEPQRDNSDISFLKHEGEVICAAVTTKRGSRPVYVSIGHMTSLETASEIVKHCTPNHRVPEPILMAHRVADAEKRKINN